MAAVVVDGFCARAAQPAVALRHLGCGLPRPDAGGPGMIGAAEWPSELVKRVAPASCCTSLCAPLNRAAPKSDREED